jgi:hypothetical protein
MRRVAGTVLQGTHTWSTSCFSFCRRSAGRLFLDEAQSVVDDAEGTPSSSGGGGGVGPVCRRALSIVCQPRVSGFVYLSAAFPIARGCAKLNSKILQARLLAWLDDRRAQGFEVGSDDLAPRGHGGLTENWVSVL